MQFAIYDVQTFELRKLGCWIETSVENEVDPGTAVGIVRSGQIDGPLVNFVFVPDSNQPVNTCWPVGVVERKRKDEWDWIAEQVYQEQATVNRRFHMLDLDDIEKLDVLLAIPSSFPRLAQPEYHLELTCESVPLHVHLSRCKPQHIEIQFDTTGHSFPLHHTLIGFGLNGHEHFIRDGICLKHGTAEPQLWTAMTLKSVVLNFGLRVANRVVESYRVAFNDPDERPIGPVDLLGGVVVVTITGGHQRSYHSGIQWRNEHRKFPLRDRSYSDIWESAEKSFINFLKDDRYPPFYPVAIAELQKAYLTGQHRECLVWAGTIINNVIEDILLKKLPKESEEYKKLKNSSADVKGKHKRKSYFKMATGKTLAEYLRGIVGEKREANGSYKFWLELPENVEKILNDRNLLIHRKYHATPQIAESAFLTCMNFIYALEYGIPFGGNLGIDL
jgi:hypothetical protein